MNDKSIVILISGSGSNLQAIIDAVQSRQINAEIKAVISNRPDAAGLDKAAKAGIKTEVIDHTKYSERNEFDDELLKTVKKHKPDLVVLAGFMRILSDDFINQFKDRLLNIHPSLLPAYKGLNTHQRALDDKCKIHGASVHFVTNELDSGLVIIQAEVPVKTDDDKNSLALRVLEKEHIIYPIAISWFVDGKLKFNNNIASFNQCEFKQPAKYINDRLIEPI